MKEVLDRAPYAWTGTLPSHWRHVRLGSCFRERHVATTAERAPALSVTKGGVVEQQEQVAKSQEGAPKKLVQPGDLVINSRSDRKGSAGLAPRLGSVSLINTVLEPTGIDAKFAYHLLRSMPFQEEFFRLGSGIVDDLWTTRYAAMKSIQLPMPPEPEQRAIADYLDHETAEIDAFMSDLKRMKSLMTERRDSDRAWLLTDGSTDSEAGDRVPWADGLFTPHGVRNIRRVAEMKTGHTPSRGMPAYWTHTDIPWFTLADVWQLRAGSKHVSETKENISVIGLANSAAELLPKGTVMLSRTASVGFTGIMGRPMATSQDYWNWVCGPLILPEYLWHQFKAMSQKFSELMSGSTHKTIYQADAASLRVVVPPVERQKQILEKLKADDADIAELANNADRAIDLAGERRAALISAAVTGQIDVTKRHKPVAEVLEDEVLERV